MPISLTFVLPLSFLIYLKIRIACKEMRLLLYLYLLFEEGGVSIFNTPMISVHYPALKGDAHELTV